MLQAADEPVVAIDLAAGLGLGGNRETQRRCVRAIVKHLRDNGSQIVATLAGGYFLTADNATWRDYLDGRQIDAKQLIGETHKRKKMLADRVGQGLLFEPPRIHCGAATMAIM